MELLKDKPEFKETIENNFFFRNEIIDIIDGIEAEVDLECDKDEMITNIVDAISKHCVNIEINGEKVGESIKDKQDLAIAIFDTVNAFTGDISIINKKK